MPIVHDVCEKNAFVSSSTIPIDINKSIVIISAVFSANVLTETSRTLICQVKLFFVHKCRLGSHVNQSLKQG